MEAQHSFPTGAEVCLIFGGPKMIVVKGRKALPDDRRVCRWVSEYDERAREICVPTSMLRVWRKEYRTLDYEFDQEFTCNGLMLMTDFAKALPNLMTEMDGGRIEYDDWSQPTGVVQLVRDITFLRRWPPVLP